MRSIHVSKACWVSSKQMPTRQADWVPLEWPQWLEGQHICVLNYPPNLAMYSFIFLRVFCMQLVNSLPSTATPQRNARPARLCGQSGPLHVPQALQHPLRAFQGVLHPQGARLGEHLLQVLDLAAWSGHAAALAACPGVRRRLCETRCDTHRCPTGSCSLIEPLGLYAHEGTPESPIRPVLRYLPRAPCKGGKRIGCRGGQLAWPVYTKRYFRRAILLPTLRCH